MVAQYVVLIGDFRNVLDDPTRAIEIFGPFSTVEAAEDYGDTWADNQDWAALSLLSLDPKG